MSENAIRTQPVSESAHSPAVRRAHERILADPRLQSRYVRLRWGGRVHIIEAGQGEPMLLLHGNTTSSLSHVPFLPLLRGIRAINLDEPGSGLSDPGPLRRLREAAVAFVDEAADALGLATFSLAGASMGGTWALWYALARPMRVRRLALLGASPLLPGTHAPAPIRAMATPIIGELMSRLPAGEGMVMRFMGMMGEGGTIARHPDVLASLVAAGRDWLAIRANLVELRQFVSALGFRERMRFRPEELRELAVPTLLIWGDRDPVGSVEAAQIVARWIPDARLEILPAGHVPWLGDPQGVAELLSGFVT